ncbi:DoxX family protein [Chloroflexus islandicus]|uniref:DoxX family protein n=1 Tax=Chloroflexus islandicus TaxID=1707952 RepID=A0A178MI76_9CHLR|nr:DoxX family membrane protein [Chloroflexus islandicus]OAN48340.1 DoxX family protein [Chloroflexus islandicus]
MDRSSTLWKAARVGLVLLRYAFGATFAYGAYHKITRGWLTTPVMRQHFEQRLSEIDQNSFSAAYLRHFAIPLYRPIAWILTIGQVIVAISMLTGKGVRPSAALALFLLVNISAGSYFNASMPPYLITAMLLMMDKEEGRLAWNETAFEQLGVGERL